jgi:hypothetical protein
VRQITPFQSRGKAKFSVDNFTDIYLQEEASFTVLKFQLVPAAVSPPTHRDGKRERPQ